MAGLTDLVILVSICAAVVYAWLTGDNRRAGFCLAMFTCTGGVMVATLLGDVGLFWLYPAMVTSFFLTVPFVAVVVNSLAVVALVIEDVAFDSHEQMLSFVTTCVVVSSCAYIFARRNEHQRERLERLATHDPLTGVKNRRAMEEELQAAVANYSRNRMPYALIIFDLDHFKRINDGFGHARGDEALVECAELIRRCTRKSDQLFRFGGEEFVLLMPGVRESGIRAVAENLRHKVASELLTPAGPITASFGVSCLDGTDDAESWLARADEALYEAKSLGRNRVVIRPSPVEPGCGSGTAGSPASRRRIPD
ncbi:GGDEF domain-containing protein [Marinobacter halodurans]|uniref:GGDEF domain-containing protein n=1 Tax=Marinobacter halodurans TaxID=2528979 RepID=UPI00310167FC